MNVTWTELTIEGARELCGADWESEFVEAVEPEVMMGLLGEGRRAWMGMVEGEFVVVADCEVKGDEVWLAVQVKRNWQRRGLGGVAVERVCEWAREQGLQRVVGGVEPKNVASLRMLKRVGFTIGKEMDEDGMFLAEKRVFSEYQNF